MLKIVSALAALIRLVVLFGAVWLFIALQIMSDSELDWKHVNSPTRRVYGTTNHADTFSDLEHISAADKPVRYKFIGPMIVDVDDEERLGKSNLICDVDDIVIESDVSETKRGNCHDIPDGDIKTLASTGPHTDDVPQSSDKDSSVRSTSITGVKRFTFSMGRMIQYDLPVPQKRKWQHKDGKPTQKRRRVLQKVGMLDTDLRFASHSCCNQKCNEKIPVEDVLAARRKAYIEADNTVDMRAELNRYREKPYRFQHMRVCVDWLKLAMLFSNNFLYYGSPGNNRPHVRQSPATDSVCKWLTEYAQSFEFMPDRNEIHLTVPSRKWVWQTYMSEADTTVDALGEFVYQRVTLQYFRFVWRKLMGHIKLLKYLRFTLCEICTLIRIKKAETRLASAISDYNKLLITHINAVKLARAAYAMRQSMAITQPKVYISLVMDGSTCAAYALPHLLMKTKDQEGAVRLKISFICTIIHGFGKFFHVVPEHVRKDSNLSIEVFMRVMLYVESHRGCLPPYLFSQHDNCGREYKNIFMLCIYVIFILRGVFVEIVMSFLQIGHLSLLGITTLKHWKTLWI